MKKIIFVLMVILFLSGCSANLNLDFSNQNMSETVEVQALKSDFPTSSYENYVDDALDFNFSKDEIRSYNKEYLNDSDYFGASFNKNYNADICWSIKSSSLKFIMPNISCKKNKDEYEIKAKASYFVCDENCYQKPDISFGTVNITLPNKAIYSNADEVSDNTYTWNFGENNDNNFELKFRIDRLNLSDEINESKTEKNNKLIILILIIPAILIVIIGINLFSKYKNKKINY